MWAIRRLTSNVIKSAIGGVLFVDEAYAITNDGGSFGQECIDTLVKLIEDFREEILIILAGYTKEMKDFMKANSGLESRFPLQIEFPDYTAEELFEIGKDMVSKKAFAFPIRPYPYSERKYMRSKSIPALLQETEEWSGILWKKLYADSQTELPSPTSLRRI